MRRLSRDSWLAIILLVVLVLVTVAAGISEATRREDAVPLASDSYAPNGARALWLWLDKLGYEVSDEVSDRFRLPEGTGLLLMLEPRVVVTEAEWHAIDDWVEDGGTLVLVGESWGTMAAVRHYDLQLRYLVQEAYTLTIQTPLLISLPLTETLTARARAYLETENHDFTVHLAAGSRPVTISCELGAGRVILSTALFPFTNAGLKEDGNPELALNVIAAAATPGVIWFDEWHHNLYAGRAEVVGPGSWLRRTPAGRSLLYVAAVILLALVLTGRRFGRPVPLPKQIVRRAPLEHVTAIANLSRRAGHRAAVLRHHHHLLKRELGKRYRLDPTLPDDEYVARLAKLNPQVDAHQLLALLRRLSHRKVSEGEMIQLATEVADQLRSE